MIRETAVISKNMWGDQPYQKIAQRALPILVRQAIAGTPITYRRLADELGMPNHRNLNFPLGSVGRTLIELGEKWGENIPPITFLVVTKSDATPGPGVAGFLRNEDEWKHLSPNQKRLITEQTLGEIFSYPKWKNVLSALNLHLEHVSFDELLQKAARMGGGGESEAHRRLKEYIRTTPNVVGVSMRNAPGKTEEKLPSGDSLDVFFDIGKEWVAIEVKPKFSDKIDLTRGIYQCIKYTAVLRAMAVAQQRDIDVRTVLALEGQLPEELCVLKTMLGIDVIENINPPST